MALNTPGIPVTIQLASEHSAVHAGEKTKITIDFQVVKSINHASLYVKLDSEDFWR